MSDTPMMDALKEAVARDAEIMRLRAGIERIRKDLKDAYNSETWVSVYDSIDLCTRLLAGEAIE